MRLLQEKKKKKDDKYDYWANVKNPHADLISYLHLKDYSTFKHKLNIISWYITSFP